MLSVKIEHFSPNSRRNDYIISMRIVTVDTISCFIWYKRGFIQRFEKYAVQKIVNLRLHQVLLH